MARRRFFVSDIRNQRAELTGDEAHHLTRVLRVERGHRYEISDNRAAWLAEVVEAHKNRVVFSVLEPVAPRPLPLRLTLLFGLYKFDHLEWMLEKGTELGVSVFVPVLADRSERGLDRAVDKRAERWQRILLEASQQCRRDHLPVLEPLIPFQQAIARTADARLFLDESGGEPIARAATAAPAGSEVLLLAGPEGGWTDRERDAAEAAGWRRTSLGPLVLRAETAALAAAAITITAGAIAPSPAPGAPGDRPNR